MSKENGTGAERPVAPLVHRPDGTPYEVPPEGSLALLALGYRGLMAWRAKRLQVQERMNEARKRP